MAHSGTLSLLAIEKLQGQTNYHQWRVSAEAVLRREQLWGIVSGRNPRRSLDQNDNEKLEEWDDSDDKAIGTLILSMIPTVQTKFIGHNTAEDLWAAIKEAYGKESVQSKLFLRTKLNKLRPVPGQSIQTYLDQIRETNQKLHALGAPVSDEDLVMTVLVGLPESYDALVQTIDARDKLPTWTDFEALVLRHEQLAKERSGGVTTTTALWTNPKGKSSGPKAGRTGNQTECYYCRKKGHFKRDCRKLKADFAAGRVDKDGKSNLGSGSAEANTASTVDAFNMITSEGANNVIDTHLASTPLDTFYIDTGASRHISPRKEWFRNLRDIPTVFIRLGGKLTTSSDAATITATQSGDVYLRVNVGNGHIVVLRNVLYAPRASANLLSVGKLDDAGYESRIKGGKYTILRPDGSTVCEGSKSDGIYRLDGAVQMTHSESGSIANAAMTATTTGAASAATLATWHRRLGHANVPAIHALANGMAEGIKISGGDAPNPCEACLAGKQIRTTMASSDGSNRAKEVLGRIHADLGGPMEVESIGGAKYVAALADDGSRHTWTLFLRQKSDFEDQFKKWLTVTESKLGLKLKIFRSDGGGEFVSKRLEDWMRSRGIDIERSAPRTQEQNGVAERTIRKLTERTRALLHDAGMSKGFWAEAMATSAYIINRVPTSSVPGHTPYEKVFGKKPNLSHLRAFGATAFVRVHPDLRKKLDPKTIRCRMLGYEIGMKAYRLWNPESYKVITIAPPDVVLDEQDGQIVELEESTGTGGGRPASNPAAPSGPAPAEAASGDSPADGDARDHGRESSPVNPEPSLAERRETRSTQMPSHLRGHYQPTGRGWSRLDRRANEEESQLAYAMTAATVDDEPTSLEEARDRPDSKEWEKAAKAEYDALMRNKTWAVEPLPKGRTAIDSKWVFKVKRDREGKIERYKGRLVARGFTQRPGIDFDETFAPVAKAVSVRAILALVAAEDLEADQMDVSSAYLNGELDVPIYMRQPPGYELPGHEGDVCRLKKTLYGLKQSGRAWRPRLWPLLRRRHLDAKPYGGNRLRTEGGNNP